MNLCRICLHRLREQESLRVEQNDEESAGIEKKKKKAKKKSDVNGRLALSRSWAPRMSMVKQSK